MERGWVTEEVFGAGFIYLGLAGLGWLVWNHNRREGNARDYELTLMVLATVYAVFMALSGRKWGVFTPFCIAGQAALITPILSNAMSNSFVGLLTHFSSLGSPHVELSDARHAHKLGDTDEAIRLILAELKKDQGHYEGNYLLAQIYWERGEALAALYCLRRMVNNNQCSEEQRAQAREELSHSLQLARERGWIPPDTTMTSLDALLPKSLKAPKIASS